ncbi:cell division protein FtsB [mine drainage metagenome]|uniref:Cell division protein FtsB n=1 Tax=mine drainage metagenome TaxID=410659 RepID=A0A1J5T8U4_9ZZZZ
MKKLSSILLNKYVLAISFFIVWMLFFDQRDIFYVREQKQKLKELENKKNYYRQEIEKAKKDLTDLQNNPAALEKFAREHYMMKKDGEDIFVIDAPADSIKK